VELYLHSPIHFHVWYLRVGTTYFHTFAFHNGQVMSTHRSLPLFPDSRADNFSFKGRRFSLPVSASVCWPVVRDWHYATHRHI
jgi:hypothetical protein